MTNYALLHTSGNVEIVEVEDYKDIQALVGGIFCAPWEGRLLDGQASLFANDEGLLMGLEYNTLASLLAGQHLVGPVLMGGAVDDEGNVTDVTDTLKSILSVWTGVPL